MKNPTKKRALLLALSGLLIASLACNFGGSPDTQAAETEEPEPQVVTATPELEPGVAAEESQAEGEPTSDGAGPAPTSSSGSSSTGSGSQSTSPTQHSATTTSSQGSQAASHTATSPPPTHTSAPGQPTSTPQPTSTSAPPSPTPSYTPTNPPAAQTAPEDARFNNPLNIPLDNTASVLDFVSYPDGDNEDRVRWDITGMNQNSSLSGGRARLVLAVSCFGNGTANIEFFTGGQSYSCGQTIVDREVTYDSRTGSVVITAVGGNGTYVQWVLTGSATRVN